MPATTATTGPSRAHSPPLAARRLLALGAVGGPLYVVVSVVQSLSRTGFDPTRHAWSQLATGELGWIQAGNLLMSGTLIAIGGIGVGRVLTSGPAATWAPRLLVGYGAGMVVAGVFPADPGRGFPPGTPEHVAPSWHGTVHFAAAGLGFLALVTACGMLARRFRAEPNPRLAALSVTTGILLGCSFIALAGSQGARPAIVATTAAVILASSWTAIVFNHYRRKGN